MDYIYFLPVEPVDPIGGKNIPVVPVEPTAGSAPNFGDFSRLPLNKDEIFDHCRKNLEPFMVPRIIEFRKSLPKFSNGKINKKRLIAELSQKKWFQNLRLCSRVRRKSSQKRSIHDSMWAFWVDLQRSHRTPDGVLKPLLNTLNSTNR